MKRIAILACMALAGCVSTQPGAEKIVMTINPAQVAGCKLLGQVNVNQVNWFGPGQMQSDAATDLRNRALKMGGTHVLTAGASPVMQAAVLQTGDVYKCRKG